MTIPVVFIHRGNQDYLKLALKQATRRNQDVVLIGDDSNKTLPCKHYRFQDYWDERLNAIYRHMTFNHAEFTLQNMGRWLVLGRWMEENGVMKAWHFDTDVMVYCNVQGIDYGESIAALQIPRKGLPAGASASGHASYWTLAGIESFCNSMYRMMTGHRGLSLLQVKWGWHLLTATAGGICDMTLLWAWALDRNVMNNAKVIDGATFEHNINVSENLLQDEYRMKDGIKEITMIKGLPHGWHNDKRKHIRFDAIHFQGHSKPLMKEYAA